MTTPWNAGPDELSYDEPRDAPENWDGEVTPAPFASFTVCPQPHVCRTYRWRGLVWFGVTNTKEFTVAAPDAETARTLLRLRGMYSDLGATVAPCAVRVMDAPERLDPID